MDQKNFIYVISVLGRYELTLREKQFVEAVKKYFNENKKVTNQQESILEGIYREKIWIRKTFFNQNNCSPKDSSSKVA